MFSGKYFHFGTLCVELDKRLSYPRGSLNRKGFPGFSVCLVETKGAPKRPFRVFELCQHLPAAGAISSIRITLEAITISLDKGIAEDLTVHSPVAVGRAVTSRSTPVIT